MSTVTGFWIAGILTGVAGEGERRCQAHSFQVRPEIGELMCKLENRKGRPKDSRRKRDPLLRDRKSRPGDSRKYPLLYGALQFC